MTAMLEVTGLGHTYQAKDGAHTAIADLSFRVGAGELVCVVGPSGCGKSTLLRTISGLIRPSKGEITLHGDEVRGVPDDLAVVFQDYSRSLFPWLTVQGNVEFPLRRGLSRAQRRTRAAEALEWVGLSAAARKHPWQLSGGMQQRVAIARALAYRPALLLMDEPFASVDAQTRFELEDLLLKVRAEHDTTVLVVTHDIDESVYLGDRVLVLSGSPASVVADLRVDLPARRDQVTTRESETFVALRAEVARLLNVGKPAEDVADRRRVDERRVDEHRADERRAARWAEAERAETERAGLVAAHERDDLFSR
ncbi:NitT/TauT family transport system ATP-binding protein [Saccharothrix coeruleofusca]|uniref:ABC transporter ATP-binding protein n=1 Tax=Saccharothrix coeruleofusca TaxID=33919 RepID=UPI001AE17247|nr:ABC transporter ATP-binding protein [Saccharothrix coeruleofusca]MBP2338025.1 NitT/TauT family transport system ATP-binding protein [Saccharothrix coeruleofusca]